MKLKLLGIFLSLCTVFALSATTSAQSVQQEINNGLCAGSNLQLPSGGNTGSCGVSNASNSIENFVKHVVNILSAVIGVVAVIMIMIGGFRYVTSGGSDSSVTSAKNTILYAIIGLIIVALSQVLVHFTIKNLTG
ncbi:MAG TPA: pilin [Candidatus Saccharimonadales bacterium]|nr:pilin [Candidatus Saccharimonadales bacterium]